MNSVNLLLEGDPKGKFNDQYKTNQATFPAIQDCPGEKPYFDGFECIACPTYSPYFSMPKQTCAACPPASKYVASEYQCSSTSGGLVSS
jgi:hypothetical protein